MVNTEIRLIKFFAARDGEALYSQQKQDQELTVAQIMNSLLPNSDLNWRKEGKPLDHSGMTLIKSFMIIQWKWEIDSLIHIYLFFFKFFSIISNYKILNMVLCAIQ